MPTVNLNKQEVLKLIGKQLSDEILKEKIPMLGTDLEDITEDEIIVEIFPNRPDMLSEQGFARALASFLNIKPGLKEYKINKSKYKVIVDKSVTMRPYTACAIVKNLKFTDERIKQIMQIQEKLAVSHGRNRKKSAYGLYPSKDINFPINYIAKDPNEITFKPLGFDKEILASKVEEIHPKGKEYKHIAKDWKKYPFFIDNKEKVMCMLPYTNSEDTGKVTEETTEVFIECTGIDFKNVMTALNLFVTMLADMGGKIYSIDIVYPDKTITTPNLEPQKMKLGIDYINKILNLNLKEENITNLLSQMGMKYRNSQAFIPAYRTDILHQIDLVEEIAIAYGYENFNTIIPKISTIAQEDEFEKFKRKISNLLVGFNLLETSSYALISEQDITKSNLNLKSIKLANALTEYNTLRPSLLPSLLKILSQNKHNEYPQNIFEINKIFAYNKKELTNLCVVLCNEKTDFTKIKQILDSLFNHLGLKYKLEEFSNNRLIGGRGAHIKLNDKNIGSIGEINPEVLTNFDIQMPISALEINLGKLYNKEEQIIDAL